MTLSLSYLKNATHARKSRRIHRLVLSYTLLENTTVDKNYTKNSKVFFLLDHFLMLSPR
jgi:hypothetical protein